MWSQVGAVYGVVAFAVLGISPVSCPAAESLGERIVRVDPDEDEAVWDTLYWLMDALCVLLGCPTAANQGSVMHSEAEVLGLIDAQVERWNNEGLQTGLTAIQRAQGVVDCTRLLRFLAANPGVLPSRVGAEYESMLLDLRFELLD